MRDLKSRVAYLQGLSAGLELGAESKEARLLNGIIEVLGEFADSMGDLEEAQEELEDYVESIDEDLYSLEDELYDKNVLGDGACSEGQLEVDCPNCGETVCFDSDILEDDDVVEVTCPNCNEVVFINDDTYQAADEPERIAGQAGEDGAPAEDEDI
ncbi:MAG: AraC family transcriptional regulator [Pelotomaculum sp.]|uniref:AraC family transcriptional regulator n=1 Tax=Pelotomaculum thermopropionicum (strain DSM 13744 / JCM 10971 / SI) TaxID=370438 RepID=A5D340_PELTS|nr:AraC family transcriptional regulator [Pelotomaculum sp.]BAF59344.1 hypothetical protein PTH_1163 [Pelotomaculum thermopropionicum SI]